jgi:hypothetical protein
VSVPWRNAPRPRNHRQLSGENAADHRARDTGTNAAIGDALAAIERGEAAVEEDFALHAAITDATAIRGSGSFSTSSAGSSSRAPVCGFRALNPRAWLMTFEEEHRVIGAGSVTWACDADAGAGDGETLRNNNLWHTAQRRERLSEFCWSVPDPNADMQLPNAFRETQRRVEREFTEWFAENEAEEDARLAASADTEIHDQLSSLHSKVDHLMSLITSPARTRRFPF